MYPNNSRNMSEKSESDELVGRVHCANRVKVFIGNRPITVVEGYFVAKNEATPKLPPDTQTPGKRIDNIRKYS